MYEFEEKLKESISFKEGRGRPNVTALWIRGYLLENGPDYVANMHRKYKEFCKKIGYKPSKYASFVRYIAELRNLGLIEVVATQPTDKRPFLVDRKYYDIKDPDLSLWNRPFSNGYRSKNK